MFILNLTLMLLSVNSLSSFENHTLVFIWNEDRYLHFIPKLEEFIKWTVKYKQK